MRRRVLNALASAVAVAVAGTVVQLVVGHFTVLAWLQSSRMLLACFALGLAPLPLSALVERSPPWAAHVVFAFVWPAFVVLVCAAPFGRPHLVIEDIAMALEVPPVFGIWASLAMSILISNYLARKPWPASLAAGCAASGAAMTAIFAFVASRPDVVVQHVYDHSAIGIAPPPGVLVQMAAWSLVPCTLAVSLTLCHTSEGPDVGEPPPSGATPPPCCPETPPP